MNSIVFFTKSFLITRLELIKGILCQISRLKASWFCINYDESINDPINGI